MSATPRSGIALVICAPSGAGKTTLIKRLMEAYSHFAFSLSCTTRPPRPGEIQGVDYDFVSKATFLERRDQGFFAEWAEVHDNFYGTPLAATQILLQDGHDIIFDIDVQGAKQLRESVPDAYFIFILPPSRAELERRLLSRGTETSESLARRLSVAGKELAEAHWFNAWVINDDLEQAWQDLRTAYLAATLSPARRQKFYTGLMREWQ